jgi:hypothetical protein
MVSVACAPLGTTVKQLGCGEALYGEFCTVCNPPVFGFTLSPVIVLSRLFDVYRKTPNAGSMATQVGPVPVPVANEPTAPEGVPVAPLIM